MLRRFFSYYRPYKGLFLLDFGCAILVGALELAFPVAVNQVIDDGGGLCVVRSGQVQCPARLAAVLHGLALHHRADMPARQPDGHRPQPGFAHPHFSIYRFHEFDISK